MLCGTPYAHLVTGCAELDMIQYTGSTSSSTSGTLSGTTSDDTWPAIGTDPSFSTKSRLYDPQVADTPGDWYNASTAGQQGGEVNEFGIPRGFTHETMDGEQMRCTKAVLNNTFC